MNKVEFMEGIHILQDNYNRKLTSSQLRLYYDNLKDMSKDKYISNIKEYIKTNSFMPTISQILNKPKVSSYRSSEERDYSNFDFNKLYANKFWKE